MGDLLKRAYGPFPTTPGILLAFSVALHIAALVEGLLGRRVDSAAFFITGQFLISLSLLRLYDGRWALQDIRLFFSLFFFLYGAALPLIILFGVAQPVPGVAGAGYMYGTAFVAFNLVQWWYRQPFVDVPSEVFRRIRPSPLNLILLAFALLAVIGYAMSRGVSIGLKIDRGQTQFLGTQLWVVMIFIVNGLTMFMFAGWSSLSRLEKLILTALLALFIVFQLAMGNRRDFLAMFIFLTGVVMTKRKSVIRLTTVIAGFVAFAGFMAIGIIRQIYEDAALLVRYNPLEILLTQNEFVTPVYTLIHYVNNVRPLRLGVTYLTAPTQFIPRALWPDKPESLSLQFMRDAFGSTGLIGFAYTPVTEAFLNFSWVGPFIVFAILSILMVKLVRNADRHAGLYFILFSLVVDFHRGEFSGTFYALCFVGGAYALMRFVSRLRWAPPRPVTVRPAPILRT
jgi:oligosaccharide repeat unit polymerase